MFFWKSLREFITSLLGQPESLDGIVEGAFEIDIGGVEYLNSLIDDRISQQNDSALLEFRAKLFFSDNSSISFNGIQSLLNYKELRPLVCDGFVFTWSYLVRFNNKQSSEKQEIQIYSIKENHPQTQSKQIAKLRKSWLTNLILHDDDLPKILYSVRCTDKGWGIEIIDLIRRCLAKFIRTDSSLGMKIRKIILNNIFIIQVSSLILYMFFLFFLQWSILDTGAHACKSLIAQVAQYNKNYYSTNDKIDFLTRLIGACNENKVIESSLLILAGVVFVAVIFFPMFAYFLAKIPDYRFLLFTEESVKRRDKYFRKLNERRTFWIGTIFLGVVVGVAGNYLFTWLSTLFR